MNYKSKPKRTKMNGVHVAKIKNRYIFRNNKGADRNKFHHYLVYTDKYTGQNVAVQTTHLYRKDKERFEELRAGRGIKMSLPGMETPSLVIKKFHTTNANGKGIDFAHRDVRIRSRISDSKAKRLFWFVKSNRNKKSRG